jgi:hypothetical protein
MLDHEVKEPTLGHGVHQWPGDFLALRWDTKRAEHHRLRGQRCPGIGAGCGRVYRVAWSNPWAEQLICPDHGNMSVISWNRDMFPDGAPVMPEAPSSRLEDFA